MSHKEGGAWDWMLWFVILLGIWGIGSLLGVLLHGQIGPGHDLCLQLVGSHLSSRTGRP